MLPPRLIKVSAAAIAQPIPNIFNASIAQWLLPECMENGASDTTVQEE